MRVAFRPILPAALAVALAASAVHAQEIDHSYVTDYDNKKVFDDELIKEVKDRLGGVATQTQVVVSACQSEFFAREGKDRLAGNWSVAASRGSKWLETNLYSKNEKEEGKVGLKISDTHYAHGWGPQYVNGIKTDATRTAKQLFDFAVANDYLGNTLGSRLESGGTGADAKLRTAGAKSVAGFWQPSSPNRDAVKTARQTLRDAGYANAEIIFAYHKGDIDYGFTVDSGAFRDKLLGNDGMIKGLADKLTAATESDKRAFLFLWTHGGLQKRKAPKADKTAFPLKSPGQGLVVQTGTPPVLFTTGPDFTAAFFTDLVDDPELSRAANPGLQVSTVWESAPGPVQVTLDGVFVGFFHLTGSPIGGYYDLVFPDPVWQSLYGSGVLADGQVAVAFHFPTMPPPYPSPSFRLATEEDFAAGSSRSYGIGLSTPSLRREVQRTTVVITRCPADWNRDGVVDSRDHDAFMADYMAGRADFNGDGVTNQADLDAFQRAFGTRCVEAPPLPPPGAS